MLEIKELHRNYDDFVLRVSFSLGKGELVSILGPNGSGKTTILRMIAGFESPDSGSIFLEGRNITRLAPERRGIGLLFQDFGLFPHMDVFGNVAYGLKIRRESKERIRREVATRLSLVGLEGFAARRVQTLSGGEQQRVALARALVTNPGVLLLDEPFAAIDTPLRRELRRELVKLRERLDISILFVTHSREEALSVSDRIVVLRSGSALQIGSPRELYERPGSRFVASFLGTANFVMEESGDSSQEGTTWMIRPDKLNFGGGDEPHGFPVRIVEGEYRGHYYEYRCAKIGKGSALFTVYDSRVRQTGEITTLWFDPKDAVVIPREDLQAE